MVGLRVIVRSNCTGAASRIAVHHDVRTIIVEVERHPLPSFHPACICKGSPSFAPEIGAVCLVGDKTKERLSRLHLHELAMDLAWNLNGFDELV